MKKIVIINMCFFLITMVTALLSGVLFIYPNHRYNDGDFGLFIVIEFLPLIYLFHGAISAPCLYRGLCKITYMAITILSIFTSFFVSYLTIDDNPLLDNIVRSIIISVLYFLCSATGVLLCSAIIAFCKKIMQLVKSKK